MFKRTAELLLNGTYKLKDIHILNINIIAIISGKVCLIVSLDAFFLVLIQFLRYALFYFCDEHWHVLLILAWLP